MLSPDPFADKFKQRPGVRDAPLDVRLNVGQLICRDESGAAHLVSIEFTDT